MVIIWTKSEGSQFSLGLNPTSSRYMLLSQIFIIGMNLILWTLSMCKLRRIAHKLSKAQRVLFGLYVKFGVIRHSSKSPIISVAMHKPNDEYFGGFL